MGSIWFFDSLFYKFEIYRTFKLNTTFTDSQTYIYKHIQTDIYYQMCKNGFDTYFSDAQTHKCVQMDITYTVHHFWSFLDRNSSLYKSLLL